MCYLLCKINGRFTNMFVNAYCIKAYTYMWSYLYNMAQLYIPYDKTWNYVRQIHVLLYRHSILQVHVVVFSVSLCSATSHLIFLTKLMHYFRQNASVFSKRYSFCQEKSKTNNYLSIWYVKEHLIFPGPRSMSRLQRNMDTMNTVLCIGQKLQTSVQYRQINK